MSLLQNNSTIRYFFCKGWKYGGAGSSWKQDDEMIIRICAQLTIITKKYSFHSFFRFGKNDPCGIITISAEGKAARYTENYNKYLNIHTRKEDLNSL